MTVNEAVQEITREDNKPVISTSHARRVLGGLASRLSDTQIREIVNTLQMLAKEQIWYDGSKTAGDDNDLRAVSR